MKQSAVLDQILTAAASQTGKLFYNMLSVNDGFYMDNAFKNTRAIE